MGGLVLCEFAGPFRWAHHQWEGPFYSAWRHWQPAQLHPDRFPNFRVGGGAGTTSQARDMLWQLKRTSPFHTYNSQPLTTSPMGLAPREYLEIWVDAAAPGDWEDLANSFLEVMKSRS